MTIKPHMLFSRNAVLDTSFFFSKGFNFRNEEMMSLSRLGESGAIQILIVDLTLREVESNMREAARTAHSKLSQSDFSVLRSLPLFRRFNDIYGDDRIFEYLYKNFQKFITTSKTKIISSNDVFPGTVFDRYFRRLPPFTADAKKNRKGEFPDAFALEAVNLWCTTNQERAYLISSDSDWHEFGKMSMELFDDQPRLIALASISELIDMVIRNDDALVDTSRFADTIFDYQKENIEAEVLSHLPAKSLHFLTTICLSSTSGKGWQDVKFCCMNTGCGCGSAQFGQITTIAARHALDHAKYMQAFNLA